MSFIRGKIEADREVRPREITFGEVPWYQSPCGCWIDKVTNKKVDATFLTFEQIEKMQSSFKKSLFTRFLDWISDLIPPSKEVKELQDSIKVRTPLEHYGTISQRELKLHDQLMIAKRELTHTKIKLDMTVKHRDVLRHQLSELGYTIPMPNGKMRRYMKKISKDIKRNNRRKK